MVVERRVDGKTFETIHADKLCLLIFLAKKAQRVVKDSKLFSIVMMILMVFAFFLSRSNHSNLIFSPFPSLTSEIILIWFLSYRDKTIYAEINAGEITARDDKFDTENINSDSNFFAVFLSSSVLNVEALTGSVMNKFVL